MFLRRFCTLLALLAAHADARYVFAHFMVRGVVQRLARLLTQRAGRHRRVVQRD